MHQTYCNIFNRLGLNFRPVIADSGNIGGSTSHEFHVLAESGEDEIVFSSHSDYAANIELAIGSLPTPNDESSEEQNSRELVDTGTASTIDEVAEKLDAKPEKTLKTLFVHAADKEGQRTDELLALVLRGDQTLSETKAEKIEEVASPIIFASDELIEKTIGCPVGCLGPFGLSKLNIRTIADISTEGLRNFICGANQPGQHFINANWNDECKPDAIIDIRKVQEGDISPDGNGTLSIKRGIEVGHIFQLGKKYSEALNATVLDENGKSVVMPMGCYGIGVTRVVAACIEQSHDAQGIIWPNAIAPFQLVIVQIDAHKSEQVAQYSEKLYQQAQSMGVEALLDDRDKKTSPGVKFADSELMGIPHRLVVSPRSLADGAIEYKGRVDEEKQLIDKDNIDNFLQALFSN
jgi:prolyl-tRNA synthetase